jgi:ABC-type uncharacterized transport system involved in gliding motility auxiliary subunit
MTNARTIGIIGAFVGVTVALCAFAVASTYAVRGLRLDLTEDRLYSLSPAVVPLVQRLDEPVKLDFYYSAEAAQGMPQIQSYANRVREFLQEVAQSSKGRITLRVIDPAPFSEAQDEARAAGIAPLRLDGSGKELMLGLVAKNSVDQAESMPFLDPNKEPFLEYDVMRLVQSIGKVKKPTIGVLSSLPIVGGGVNPANPRQPVEPWQIYLQLKQLYQVKDIATTDAALPEGLDALVIVHPRELSTELLRSIDAFALKGGRILAFLDPHCEAQPSQDRFSGGSGDKSSDLGPLTRAWGIEWTRSKVVADSTYAQRVRVRSQGPVREMDYPIWLALREDALAKGDPSTGRLSQINAQTMGAIDIRESNKATVKPLMESSAESMRLDGVRIQFFPDPEGLMRDFKPEGKRNVLAVRVQGPIEAAYDEEGNPTIAPPESSKPVMLAPDGSELPAAPNAPAPVAPAPATPPAAADGTPGKGPFQDSAPAASATAMPAPAQPAPAPAQAPTAEPSAASTTKAPRIGTGNIVIVADADLLSDQNWIEQQRMGNLVLGSRVMADNGAFVLNVLEMFTGDEALLNLRARGKYQRPFDRVEEIRKAAEQQYLARERELQNQIRQSEARLTELQAQKTPENQLILSPEQEAEVVKLEEQTLAARKELRSVQFNLRREVEGLGTRLLLVNVVAWPLAVAALAAIMLARRSHLHRSTKKA